MVFQRTAVLLIGLMMLPWLLPAASAATTVGQTVELINPEQRVREMSSAIPVYGFGMTADAAEALHSVNVTFTGASFDAGNNRDLASLTTDSATSGVGIYRDSGALDDVLDPGDTPVTLDGNVWSGIEVQISLSAHNEPVPMAQVGNYSWFVVIRTSNNTAYLHDADRIIARIYTDDIIATSAGGLVYQPAADLASDAMIVRFTRGVNIVTDPWIGPAGVLVHEMPMLGLRIVDGGGGVNSGINDWLTQLQFELYTDNGVITSSDFAPITTDGATSGFALYRDNGGSDDVFDANDTPITLAAITPATFGLASPELITMVFNPALAVPDDVTGTFDFMLIVRSGTITSNDAFYVHFLPSSLRVSGMLAADADHTALYSGWSNYGSVVNGDDTPPTLSSVGWSESAQNLAVWGNTLYFNHQMTFQENATAQGYASDSESGLRNATFSNEAGLAMSPSPYTFSRYPWSGGEYGTGRYGFNTSSDDGGSPVDFTVYDWVGNSVTAGAVAKPLNYTHRENALLLSGGWTSPSWPLYVAPDGTLYFSDHIYGSSQVDLDVQAISLYGGGLKNVSASTLSTVVGPSNPFDTYTPGTYSATFSTTYTFRANSTQGAGLVTVTALDQSGNTLTMDFTVREDNAPPVIDIVSPTGGTPVRGNIRIIVDISDSGSGVSGAEVQVDPRNGSQTMYFDGTHYFYDLPSDLFTDGPHAIIVTAWDNAGNTVAATVNVEFANGVKDTVPPLVALVAPSSGAHVSNTVTVQVSASDVAGVAGVWVRDGQGAWQQASWNAATGFYEFAWSTANLSDGEHWLTAMARDTSGVEAQTAAVSVWVDNHAPQASVAGPAPAQEVAGVYTVRVYADDANGIASVTLTVGGRTVNMAYNPASGYFEYSLDTRTLKDGAYTATAVVTDGSGKTTSTQTVDFKVQNGDTWRGLRESTNFLFLLFVILAFLAVLMWARNGTLHRWIQGETAMGGKKDEKKEDEKEVKK